MLLLRTQGLASPTRKGAQTIVPVVCQPRLSQVCVLACLWLLHEVAALVASVSAAVLVAHVGCRYQPLLMPPPPGHGHAEYTQSNARFAVSVDPHNEQLADRKARIDQQRSKVGSHQGHWLMACATTHDVKLSRAPSPASRDLQLVTGCALCFSWWHFLTYVT